MLALSGAGYSAYYPTAIEPLRISMPSIFGTEFASNTDRIKREKLS